jgi:hypothetical protein
MQVDKLLRNFDRITIIESDDILDLEAIISKCGQNVEVNIIFSYVKLFKKQMLSLIFGLYKEHELVISTNKIYKEIRTRCTNYSDEIALDIITSCLIDICNINDDILILIIHYLFDTDCKNLYCK